MIVHCKDKLKAVIAFAKSFGNGSYETLIRSLQIIGRKSHWGKDKECHLYSDFAPHSFYFEMKRDGQVCMNGGIIFYKGAESGVNSPQYSVTLSGRSDSRWEVHT